jgi:phosphatidylserine decarboxylase
MTNGRLKVDGILREEFAREQSNLELGAMATTIGGMKHAGKARKAGLKLIVLSLTIVLLVVAVWSFLAGAPQLGVALGLGIAWLLFLALSLTFFRDPDATVPATPLAIVSPAHGTVDMIDETVEKQFMGGRCKRISIFLSLFDVHVQNAPVAGKVAMFKHCPGRFVNAMRKDCGDYNENVFIGFESSEAPGERIAIRLIAGLLARRIVPWVKVGDELARGERTSLIQFGSRVDIYLPLTAALKVELGDKVKGGETVVAVRS